MRVINISHSDYANFSYYVGESMKSVGINTDSYILKKHPFNYAKQAHHVNADKIIEECLKADIIQVMHTCGTMWDIVKFLNKPIVVWHTGTRYRQGYDKHNPRWNPLAVKHICVLPELMKLGCINPEFISMTVETDRFTPDYATPDILRIAHYPSNQIVKGTKEILNMMRKITTHHRKHRFSYDIKRVDFRAQIKRMAECDIYIELFAPKQDGYEYGSFGTTALEAAAMGKIVVTNNINDDVYQKYYGKSELVIANTFTKFDSAMRELLDMSREEIIEKKQKTRLWVEKNHSLKATGTRIQEMLKGVLNQRQPSEC